VIRRTGINITNTTQERDERGEDNEGGEQKHKDDEQFEER